MASIQQRGDVFFAQVRIKKAGVIVFSESKTFPTEAMAKSWAERLEDKVRKDGAPTRSMTVGELILEHLAYQQKLRPLGRSTIFNHETTAQAFKTLGLPSSFTLASTTSATMVSKLSTIAIPRPTPSGSGVPQPAFCAATSNTCR